MEDTTEGRSENGRPDRTFELEGQRYELPLLSTFNLDEERILYVYADVVIQDLMPLHPDMDEAEKMVEQARQFRRFRNPELKRAVAHVAYKRSHPDATEEAIERALGTVNALELDIAMFAEVEDPTKNSQTSSSSERNESERTDQSSSGSPTESTSPSPVLSLAPTGTTGSDTSSTFHQATPV